MVVWLQSPNSFVYKYKVFNASLYEISRHETGCLVRGTADVLGPSEGIVATPIWGVPLKAASREDRPYWTASAPKSLAGLKSILAQRALLLFVGYSNIRHQSRRTLAITNAIGKNFQTSCQFAMLFSDLDPLPLLLLVIVRIVQGC